MRTTTGAAVVGQQPAQLVVQPTRKLRIRIRPVDKSRWAEEVEIVLSILNDAWSKNWGFVPFTPEEIAYAGKKLKPIIHPQINLIAEVDGIATAAGLQLTTLPAGRTPPERPQPHWRVRRRRY